MAVSRELASMGLYVAVLLFGLVIPYIEVVRWLMMYCFFPLASEVVRPMPMTWRARITALRRF